METFNFKICETNYNIPIYAASLEQAENILEGYIEEHELNWNYIYE